MLMQVPARGSVTTRMTTEESTPHRKAGVVEPALGLVPGTSAPQIMPYQLC